MADSKVIHEFAVEWFSKFRDAKTTGHDLAEDSAFSDACFSFNFKMDCGEAFIATYSHNEFHDYRELDKIIDSINDISLLGSALFSRWRYFNHMAYSSEEITEGDNRAWFITAFSRLERLTADSDESPFIFQREKRKESRSYPIAWNTGRCHSLMMKRSSTFPLWKTAGYSFSSYNYGNGNKYEKAKTRNFKVEPGSAKDMLKLIGDYFSNQFNVPYATDVGAWELSITNTDAVTFDFTGSLCPMIPELENVSSTIRTYLNMPDLLVFDGDSHEDRIEKIVIDYRRVTKIRPKEPINPNIEYATWDYSEHIALDRASESLEHIQNIASGCTVSRKYHVEDGISAFLDDHYSSSLFSSIKGNPPDAIDDPLETKDYTITVDYLYGGQRVISGSFDKNGLPEDFPELAEDIMNFMCFYGMGEILDPSAYGKTLRRPGKYIYLSAFFEDSGKTYYYRTDDDRLKIGDLCIVPVGKDNHEAVVRIEKIEFFSEDNVPLPLDKTKMIIRKCTEDDLRPSK